MNKEVRDSRLRRRVLVVEDEFINQQILGNIVSQEYDVIYADNGAEAMDLIREYGRRISIILLDIIMPKMDGIEVMKALREDEALSKIPVIVLTADKSKEVESLKLGAVDFISKPYDVPEVVLARVRRSIELAEDTNIIQKAERDELTGLYTKDFFYEYSRRWLEYHPEVARDAVVVNINHFHLINDLYGREAGDGFLTAIGGKIARLVSDCGGMACRTDADHFYLYIPHREDMESALEQISLGEEDSADYARVRLRMGVYQNADPEVDLDRVFDRAVLACNTIRNNYTTAIAFYDEAMHEREVHSERLISEIDEALETKQFKVYFQPKYNITGDKPVLSSAEALVRWIHPELGFVSPGAFIPLFEDNGLIQRLDHYVWTEAARQIREWKDRYGAAVPVSVNVSRIDIYDPRLEQDLLDIIRDTGLETGDLFLEITESAYTDNSTQIIEVIESLRAQGFSIEMDDFGSGYSSLNMITTLPVDVIKLDMQFIRNMTASEKNIRMVELMMDIARFLNVPVVAEGVETKEQLEVLKRVGCDIIQGYYFSKPVPAEEFAPFIEEKLKDQ